MRQLHALGVAVGQITRGGTAPGVIRVAAHKNGEFQIDRWAPAGIGNNPTDVPPVQRLVVYMDGDRWRVREGYINLD